MIAAVLPDVRYCLRGFAREPLLAIVVVATLALAAGYRPARRAAQVDPVTALRGD